MKASKKTSLCIMGASKDGSIDASVSSRTYPIRLRAISAAERQKARIPSYKYILP